MRDALERTHPREAVSRLDSHSARTWIQGYEAADARRLLEEGGDAEEVAFFFPGSHYLDADWEAGLGEAAGDRDDGAAGESECEGEYEPAYVGGEGVAFHLSEVAGVHVERGRDDGGTDEHVVVAEEFGASVDYGAAS